MKIKQLTAGLAVAAMAAGFTLASPMLSANAYTTDPQNMMIVAPDLSANAYGSKTAPKPTSIDVIAQLAADPTNVSIAGTDWWIDGINGTNLYDAANISSNGGFPGFSWSCHDVQIVSQDRLATLANRDQITNYGTVSCSGGQLVYKPAVGMGVNAIDTVEVYYEMWLNGPATTPAWAHGLGIKGFVTVTISPYVAPDPCAGFTAVCLSATLQAYGKGDDPTSATLTTIKPNTGLKLPLTSADMAARYALKVVEHGVASGDSLLSADVNNKLIVQGSKKDPNSVTFTAPKNWSGVVTYDYIIAPFVTNAAGVRSFVQDQTQWFTGQLMFVVQPTLPGIDPIASDPAAKVTVPVLEQSIIGSKSFGNAACTFADTKGKTTLKGTGAITNKGGSKDPIFTPEADFAGSVNLVCTVQDKWGTTSNAITVTINVGKVAPVAPACDKNCGSSIISVTGGSVASPMTTGMAAIVLMMAAGAGVLVVRRRTSLAG